MFCEALFKLLLNVASKACRAEASAKSAVDLASCSLIIAAAAAELLVANVVDSLSTVVTMALSAVTRASTSCSYSACALLLLSSIRFTWFFPAFSIFSNCCSRYA